MTSPRGEFPLVQISVDVGVADRLFTRQFPFGIKITRSYLSCAAADATDKVTASVTVGAATIKTSTTAIAVDTIYEDIGVAATASDFIPANTPFKILLDFAGTAANVKGVSFVLMGAVKL